MSSNLRRAPQAEQVKRTVLDAIALHKSGRLPAAIEKYRYALGLDPAQLKMILVTHGHADHFGGAAEVELFRDRDEVAKLA